MKIWMDGYCYGVLLFCRCFAVVLLLLLAVLLLMTMVKRMATAATTTCVPRQEHTLNSHVLVEQNRLCTHCTDDEHDDDGEDKLIYFQQIIVNKAHCHPR